MSSLLTTAALDAYAGYFKPKTRRYPSPGALAKALDPLTSMTSPALELIDQELVDLTDGTGGHNALAVFMPPQEGKSQRVSRRYPEWLLGHNPALRIAGDSHQRDMA